ncbi:MAG: hypothetical protein LZF60_80477 [Nitrospira sp.]|nr:MAG: hypothetical protein LZF60_80477 [Nitrospira sp.]
MLELSPVLGLVVYPEGECWWIVSCFDTALLTIVRTGGGATRTGRSQKKAGFVPGNRAKDCSLWALSRRTSFQAR